MLSSFWSYHCTDSRFQPSSCIVMINSSSSTGQMNSPWGTSAKDLNLFAGLQILKQCRHPPLSQHLDFLDQPYAKQADSSTFAWQWHCFTWIKVIMHLSELDLPAKDGKLILLTQFFDPIITFLDLSSKKKKCVVPVFIPIFLARSKKLEFILFFCQDVCPASVTDC